MIELCEEQEAIDILNEPENQKRLGIKTEFLKFQPWIARIDGCRMIFFFWCLGSSTYEVHITASSDSVRKSRVLAKEIMRFLFTHGVSRIVTDCPKGKIYNFLKKIGMRKVRKDGDKIYMEVSKWELAQL